MILDSKNIYVKDKMDLLFQFSKKSDQLLSILKFESVNFFQYTIIIIVNRPWSILVIIYLITWS